MRGLSVVPAAWAKELAPLGYTRPQGLPGKEGPGTPGALPLIPLGGGDLRRVAATFIRPCSEVPARCGRSDRDTGDVPSNAPAASAFRPLDALPGLKGSRVAATYQSGAARVNAGPVAPRELSSRRDGHPNPTASGVFLARSLSRSLQIQGKPMNPTHIGSSPKGRRVHLTDSKGWSACSRRLTDISPIDECALKFDDPWCGTCFHRVAEYAIQDILCWGRDLAGARTTPPRLCVGMPTPRSTWRSS